MQQTCHGSKEGKNENKRLTNNCYNFHKKDYPFYHFIGKIITSNVEKAHALKLSTYDISSILLSSSLST